MKIRIKHPAGAPTTETRVMDAETGQPMDGVVRIEIVFEGKEIPRGVLTFGDPKQQPDLELQQLEVDVVADGYVKGRRDLDAEAVRQGEHEEEGLTKAMALPGDHADRLAEIEQSCDPENDRALAPVQARDVLWLCAQLRALADACLAYDRAIKACADDPAKMASFCTAQGTDLDVLYATWRDLAAALRKPTHG